VTLELSHVSKQVGGETHISDVSLKLASGTLTILLGPTLSGKTSVMRLMAGLDKPTAGQVLIDGADVTGVPVQKRSVAMVYQQFINYPNLTVYENIASPMRVAGLGREETDAAVQRAADLMRLTPLLDRKPLELSGGQQQRTALARAIRKPLELSGGQQQRTALARAIVKGADLVLLDEPLANLDYKLREELREELPRLFSETGAIFVYATTEPTEALLLGGNTATLHEGRVTQFGGTLDVYRRPVDRNTADVFSDPPMNFLAIRVSGGQVTARNQTLPPTGQLAGLADGQYAIGFRPNHLHLTRPGASAIPVTANVAVTEITGSESFVHLDFNGQRWIALLHGIHDLEPGSAAEVFLDPSRFYVFNDNDALVAAPDLAEAA
jgi:glycerol transport system ATP-binding protein